MAMIIVTARLVRCMFMSMCLSMGVFTARLVRHIFMSMSVSMALFTACIKRREELKDLSLAFITHTAIRREVSWIDGRRIIQIPVIKYCTLLPSNLVISVKLGS